MKKFIVVFGCLVFLAGCGSAQSEDFKKLDDEQKEVLGQEGVDSGTFKDIDYYYSKDKNNCYEHGEIVDMSKCEALSK